MTSAISVFFALETSWGCLGKCGCEWDEEDMKPLGSGYSPDLSKDVPGRELDQG